MWIACKDKMPESGKDVLLYSSYGVSCGIYWNKQDGGDHFKLDYGDLIADKSEVSHWQDLPPPPSQEK